MPGSAPLLIYCLLKGIRINVPKLIIDYMTSDHLPVLNRHLPFGMLITRLLKQLRFDLSTERSIEPSVDINSTLLKRTRVRERAPAPQPQPIIPAFASGFSSGSSASFDPYHALSTQLREHSQQMSAQMAAHFQRLEQQVDNDLNHICDSIRYMQTCVHNIYNKHTWSGPLPSGRGSSFCHIGSSCCS